MKILNNLLVALIVTGIIFLFNRFIPNPGKNHYVYVLLALFGLKWLLSRVPNPKIHIQNLFRKNFPKIGILNGKVANGPHECMCERVWSNVTPGMWLVELKKQTKRIKMIATSEINDTFTMIINPFGDAYPEKNGKMHSTFFEIRDYILNGGVFVCTGGSFFLHHITEAAQKAEWAIRNIVNNVQSMSDSLFSYTFSAITTGNTYLNGQVIKKEPLDIEIYQKREDRDHTGNITIPNKIKRFRALTPATTDYIPLIREKNDASFPIAIIPYGQGHIIHAGIYLHSEESDEFKLLVAIIKELTKSKFKSL